MIGRVETQHDIAYFKLRDTPIEIPNMRTNKTKIYDLPSDKEINACIEEAKQEAIKDAALLGMCLESYDEIDKHQFDIPKNFGDLNCTEIEESDDEEDSGEERNDKFDDSEMEDDAVTIKEETTKKKFSPFVTILDDKGVERLVRKTTYVWMLTEKYDKLSNDRMKRFQKNTKKTAKRRRTEN